MKMPLALSAVYLSLSFGQYGNTPFKEAYSTPIPALRSTSLEDLQQTPGIALLTQYPAYEHREYHVALWLVNNTEATLEVDTPFVLERQSEIGWETVLTDGLLDNPTIAFPIPQGETRLIGAYIGDLLAMSPCIWGTAILCAPAF